MPPISDDAIPRANVLGIGISAINLAQALRLCDEFLQRGRKGYICVTGVHGVMEAQRDPAFRHILNRSILCTPDGMPTVWVGRLQGHTEMSRVYGPDFMLEMCKLSVGHCYRHFLFGGKPGVVEQLRSRLVAIVPGIDIVGTYTPPFRALTPAEEEDLIDSVQRSAPDIFWVGLSTPKQECFMAKYLDRLDTSLMIGVGAAFDIHAGLLADAPQFMKSCGLQWLHRLWKEPRRLWRRYLTNNPRFLWGMALQFLGIRRLELGPL